MKNKFHSMDKEELQEIVDSSNSIREAIEKTGSRDVGGNRRTFYKVLKVLGVSLNELEKNRGIALKDGKFSANKLNEEEIFVENSKVKRSVVKSRIIKNNLIEYKCSVCGNKGDWLGKILVLHLEHKNGIGNDNRLGNLCFLCPNCHSQTKTFAGRNFNESGKWAESFKKEKERKTEEEIYRLRMLASKKANVKKRQLTEEQVRFVLNNEGNLSKRAMGRMFGVCDRTIGKIIRNNGYSNYDKTLKKLEKNQKLLYN